MLEQVIAKFEAKQEKEQDRTAWRVQEQRILEELAFPLWMECRNAIEMSCNKYSKHFYFEVQPDTNAVARSTETHKVLSVEYFPNSHTIAYQVGTITHRYTMRINDNRQAVILDQTRDVFKSPQEVADDLLSLLFS